MHSIADLCPHIPGISNFSFDKLEGPHKGQQQNLIGEWLKETASSSTDGFKITYAIGESVSGTQRGSAIDTR